MHLYLRSAWRQYRFHFELSCLESHAEFNLVQLSYTLFVSLPVSLFNMDHFAVHFSAGIGLLNLVFRICKYEKHYDCK